MGESEITIEDAVALTLKAIYHRLHSVEGSPPNVIIETQAKVIVHLTEIIEMLLGQVQGKEEV